jgi:uncharacterized protein (TIGR03083 family)
MDAAEEEYRRLDRQLATFGPEDWSRPTDCAPWDVRAVVAHLVGAAEATGGTRERVHQLVAGLRRRRRGELLIDAMNAIQVAERLDRTPLQLRADLLRSARLSIQARRRIPTPVRRLRLPLGQPLGACSLERLLGTIYTRDAWMHRIDLARATGRQLELSPPHDGLIVAHAVEEWADLHGQPFHLDLTGPAGGSWARGVATESATWSMDAVEFCRILSGRGRASGLLARPLVF